MKTAAVIPIKHLECAKSRLSPGLTPLDRRELSIAMLLDMLTCLRAVQAIDDVFVICADPIVLAALKISFPQVRLLNKDCSLNDAASYAMRALREQGIERMLFLHGDLPLIRNADITALLQAAPNPGVLLLCDKTHTGTNGIAATPPDILPNTAFGPNSLHCHVQLCNSEGIPAEIFRNEATSFDVDHPQDLVRLAQEGAGLRSAALLRGIGQARSST